MKILSALFAVALALQLTPLRKWANQRPTLRLPDLSGKQHELSDYKGKYVVLEWVNFGCPFVRKHYGSENMQKLQKEFADKGVVWLSICSSAPGQAGKRDPGCCQERHLQIRLGSQRLPRGCGRQGGQALQCEDDAPNVRHRSRGHLIYAGAIDDKPTPNPSTLTGPTTT